MAVHKREGWVGTASWDRVWWKRDVDGCTGAGGWVTAVAMVTAPQAMDDHPHTCVLELLQVGYLSIYN